MFNLWQEVHLPLREIILVLSKQRLMQVSKLAEQQASKRRGVHLQQTRTEGKSVF